MIEEIWTGFKWGTAVHPIELADGREVPGRVVNVHDPVSNRFIFLKMTEDEAKAFASAIAEPKAPEPEQKPVIATGIPDDLLRRGGPLPGMPDGPPMPPGGPRRG